MLKDGERKDIVKARILEGKMMRVGRNVEFLGIDAKVGFDELRMLAMIDTRAELKHGLAGGIRFVDEIQPELGRVDGGGWIWDRKEVQALHVNGWMNDRNPMKGWEVGLAPRATQEGASERAEALFARGT